VRRVPHNLYTSVATNHPRPQSRYRRFIRYRKLQLPVQSTRLVPSSARTPGPAIYPRDRLITMRRHHTIFFPYIQTRGLYVHRTTVRFGFCHIVHKRILTKSKPIRCTGARRRRVYRRDHFSRTPFYVRKMFLVKTNQEITFLNGDVLFLNAASVLLKRSQCLHPLLFNRLVRFPFALTATYRCFQRYVYQTQPKRMNDNEFSLFVSNVRERLMYLNIVVGLMDGGGLDGKLTTYPFNFYSVVSIHFTVS